MDERISGVNDQDEQTLANLPPRFRHVDSELEKNSIRRERTTTRDRDPGDNTENTERMASQTGTRPRTDYKRRQLEWEESQRKFEAEERRREEKRRQLEWEDLKRKFEAEDERRREKKRS